MKEFVFQGRREGAYKKKKEELLLEVAPKVLFKGWWTVSEREEEI